MGGIKWLLAGSALAGIVSTSTPARAAPVSCSTGTIELTAESDSMPLAGSLIFNVGQHARLKSNVSGFTATDITWAIDGPFIKDYNDDLGTQMQTPPSLPLPWSETFHSASDMKLPDVSLYWKPSGAQIHPQVPVPETRNVSVTVRDGGIECTDSMVVTVERNLTDPDRQPEDFYTSNHNTGTTTTAGWGGVIDEHYFWHANWQNLAANPGDWALFLPWHNYFLRRFDEWRQAFGYPPVAPWYPGRPLPTGAEFDHPPALRQVYDGDDPLNRIPTWFTLAGSPTLTGPGGTKKLADFVDLQTFSDEFEFSYHGDIHCTIGVWSGAFGSMCNTTSPKDPIFWRWHGFIDRLYRNYCTIKSLTCHLPAVAVSDPWMGDNPIDITPNGGVPPSPPLHYVSPDIWNRRAPVTDALCLPGVDPTPLNTVGGVTRDCGNDLQHENPEEGKTNYFYANLRNTGTAPVENVYAEVAVYIADASTGLSWPADFEMLPESRQFITLNLKPGQVTAIGPLPWTAPSNATSDHWCIYVRILSVQEGALVEGTVVDTNVANSNSIAWRNLKIVNPGEKKVSRFIVRNIRRETEALDLTFDAAPALMRGGRILLQLDPALQRALAQGPLPDGVRALGKGRYVLTGLRTRIEGLRLPPRGQGVAQITLEGVPAGATGDVVVTQASRAGVDGGVVLRVAGKRPRGYPRR